jgi:hypothetical protein
MACLQSRQLSYGRLKTCWKRLTLFPDRVGDTVSSCQGVSPVDRRQKVPSWCLSLQGYWRSGAASGKTILYAGQLPTATHLVLFMPAPGESTDCVNLAVISVHAY